MARYRLVISVEASNEFEAIASFSPFHDVLSRIHQNGNPSRFGVSPVELLPDPVGAYGKHGMADGLRAVSFVDVHAKPRLGNVGMDDAGPAPIHQPEKRPATCACCMGAGAQPYAHEPSCPVHPRYVDTGLSDADGKARDVHASHLDHAEQDGEG